jgi:hypothetical protein
MADLQAQKAFNAKERMSSQVSSSFVIHKTSVGDPDPYVFWPPG